MINLDQQSQLNNFRNYLKTQTEFKDYDFNGSAMNVLLELLAQNTFRNAFYFNMIFAERWIDSAQLRSSLFSQAKELNYLPRSSRSAVAKIKVNFEATGESQPYTIQKGSQFSTLIKSRSYTFTIPETISVSSVDTNFEFETEIYEGVYVRDSYVFREEDATQFFEITNKNIDTRSLTVTVFEDGNEIGDTYKVATSLLGLSHQSKVFFLQTSHIGGYEIYFGNNILGRRPKSDAVIVLDYRLSNGKTGNGAKSFSVDFDPTNTNELLSTPDLEIIEASKNGDDAEDNESIRYYAPRAYQVQERAVVDTDYEIMLKAQFPEINSISVFGGDELEPPQFSKVYLSIDINGVNGLPESKKTEYFNFLKERSLFGNALLPKFIEPEILYVHVDAHVRYNLNITSNTGNRIKSLILETINAYNKEHLNDFKSTLRESDLLTEIQNTDDSIISSRVNINYFKKYQAKTGVPLTFVINYGFQLKNDIPKQADVYPADDIKTIYSSPFTYSGASVVIEDDNDGKLRLVRLEDNMKRKIVDIGTVDYEKGVLKIDSLIVDSYTGSGISFFAKARDQDITSKSNNIMRINPEDIVITTESQRV